MSSRVPLLLASLIVVLSPSSVQAQALNIDLGYILGTPSDTFGAASGQAGRWNTVTNVSYTYNLLDTSGAPTPANITLSAGSLVEWADLCAEADANALVGDNYSASSYWKIVVLNLTNGIYDLFLYAPSKGGIATGAMVVNGISVASIPGDDCGLIEGGGWTRVTLEVQGGSFWMNGNSTVPIGLAGFQLMPPIFEDGFESGDTSAWSSTVQ